MSDFKENDHPRDGDGKFSPTGEGGVNIQQDGYSIHPEVHHAVNSQMERLLNRYPKLKGWMAPVKYKSGTTNEYDQFDKEIRLTGYGMDQPLAKVNQQVDSDNAPGFVLGSGLPDLITHEFGHALDHFIKQNGDDATKDEWFDLKKKLSAELGAPSKYAEKNIAEWVAERFLGEHLGQLPAALVLEIDKFMERVEAPAPKKIRKAKVKADSVEAKDDSSVIDMVNQVAAQIGDPKMHVFKKAAGILFITDGGKVLLGRRAMYGDYGGYWGIFGGHNEPGETLELTAIREVLEEAGHAVEVPEVLTPKGEAALPPPLQLIATTITDNTEFSYFVNVCKPFDAFLNDEHTEAGWFGAGELPDGPLHPGLLDVLNSPEVMALRVSKMHETDIARAMALGALPSPTKFANVSFYRMRVTGTGTAFRRGSAEELNKNGKVSKKAVQDEYVYRKPENYLTQDFLDRCNGLPLIFNHPKGKVLDSKEFSDRMIGVIVCPFIVEDEVWGVAKVYDADSVALLDNEKMSTSPTVVFHDRSENHTIALNDGSVLLIEGRPSLLDHLAVCEQGVWDKGEEPSGVESELVIADAVHSEKPTGVVEMSEAEDKAKADAEAAEKAKADAAPAWADALMKRMDSMESVFKNSRADAEEKAKADAEEKAKADAEEEKAKADAEEAAAKKEAEDKEKAKPAETAADKKADEDKAKADAEAAKEKEEAKADSARKDKALADMAKRLDALTGAVHISDADRVALAEIQARADTVANAFGERAAQPLAGETTVAYRKRLAAKYKSYSPAWKGVDIAAMDDAILPIAETQIYADSLAAASSPADVPAGTLREVKRPDRTGRVISEFVGAKSAWMDQFKSPAQLQVRINKEVH